MDRVARLTLRQIYQLYLHPRDEFGRVQSREPLPALLEGNAEPGSDQDAMAFFVTCKRFGQSREASERTWLAKWGRLPETPWYTHLAVNWR